MILEVIIRGGNIGTRVVPAASVRAFHMTRADLIPKFEDEQVMVEWKGPNNRT